MKRVLVFPCGSEIGLEIYRALHYEKNIELWGGSSVSSNHGRFLYRNYIEDIPFVSERDFINDLNKILKKKSIDYIFPALDNVLLKLSKHQKQICSQVIGSPYKTNLICSSKSETYRLFRDEIKVPIVYQLAEIEDNFEKYPVFLKPDQGYGSRGTLVAKSRKEVLFSLEENPSLLILEFLSGKEYTVECFTNYKGELQFVGGRERIRIKGGISVNSREVENQDFYRIANTINRKLDFQGVWFFQLKENDAKELVLMEIAPRVAGTMAFFRNKGVNLPLLSFFDAQNVDVNIIINNFQLEIDRALCNRFQLDFQYKYVYIDFDDCLIVNGKINTTLMMFLYQCFNKGIKIILLTRHAGDIQTTLKDFRLASLFDEVINISGSASKADYIKYHPCILIDDAFSERIEVQKKLDVPVYDLSAVESLIDWRS